MRDFVAVPLRESESTAPACSPQCDSWPSAACWTELLLPWNWRKAELPQPSPAVHAFQRASIRRSAALLTLMAVAVALGCSIGIYSYREGHRGIAQRNKKTALIVESQALAYNFVVKDAGDNGRCVNGKYVQHGMYNGKPLYSQTGGGAIIYFDFFWKINYRNSTGGWFYAIAANGDIPPDGLWTTFGYTGGDVDPPPIVARVTVEDAQATCSGKDDNCAETKCCEDSNLKCYLKWSKTAACMESCDPGKDRAECKLMSSASMVPPRTTSSPGTIAEEGPVVSASPASAGHCSDDGADCLQSKCCRSPGMTCYEKFAPGKHYKGAAVCKASCDPAVDKMSCKLHTKDVESSSRMLLLPQAAPLDRCSQGEENCYGSRCCIDATMRCYEFAPTMASCRRSCSMGIASMPCKTVRNMAESPKPSLTHVS